MPSTQMNEKERHEGVGADESQRNLRPAEPLPEEPKGSSARKLIVVLVIALVVAGAVWKIRRNTKEENGVQMMMAAQADQPTPVQVSAVQQKTMPIF